MTAPTVGTTKPEKARRPRWVSRKLLPADPADLALWAMVADAMNTPRPV